MADVIGSNISILRSYYALVPALLTPRIVPTIVLASDLVDLAERFS
jgi:hypothetical protein